MTTTLDIAAALSAVIWPVIVLAILLAYRSRIPMLVEGPASRLKTLEFAGVCLEFALAKPFVPEWSGAPTALNLRHQATAIQFQGSTARTFLTQLTNEGTGDYAETYGSFTDRYFPPLKLAAFWFDKLAILNPLGGSWDTIGPNHIARNALRQLKDGRILKIVTAADHSRSTSTSAKPPVATCPTASSLSCVSDRLTSQANTASRSRSRRSLRSCRPTYPAPPVGRLRARSRGIPSMPQSVRWCSSENFQDAPMAGNVSAARQLRRILLKTVIVRTGQEKGLH